MTTASDLLFSGSRDGTFFALDARTGEVLWERQLGAAVEAGPMSYAVDGDQYITIQVGHTMFNFGLPD
jgi:glucose dehydrogenase